MNKALKTLTLIFTSVVTIGLAAGGGNDDAPQQQQVPVTPPPVVEAPKQETPPVKIVSREDSLKAAEEKRVQDSTRHAQDSIKFAQDSLKAAEETRIADEKRAQDSVAAYRTAELETYGQEAAWDLQERAADLSADSTGIGGAKIPVITGAFGKKMSNETFKVIGTIVSGDKGFQTTVIVTDTRTGKSVTYTGDKMTQKKDSTAELETYGQMVAWNLQEKADSLYAVGSKGQGISTITEAFRKKFNTATFKVAGTISASEGENGRFHSTVIVTDTRTGQKITYHAGKPTDEKTAPKP